MNLYMIKSTMPSDYVLDESKMDFPAQVTDLRTGIVYVVETEGATPIRIGGTEKMIKSFYVKVGGSGDILEIMNGSETPSDTDEFTHTASILVSVSQGNENAQFFATNYNKSAFALVTLINGGVLEVAPQPS